MKREAKPKARLELSLDPDLKNDLRRMADARKESMVQFIEMLIRQEKAVQENLAFIAETSKNT